MRNAPNLNIQSTILRRFGTVVNESFFDIGLFLSCVGVVLIWISILKMKNYLKSQGKDWIKNWQWVPGTELGVIMDYVSLTKNNTGKLGIWFKLCLIGALLPFLFIFYLFSHELKIL
jgi:hypothetical protein